MRYHLVTPLEARQGKQGLQVVDDIKGFSFLWAGEDAGRFCCTPNTDENYMCMKNRWMKSFLNHSVAEIGKKTEGL